MHQPYLVFSVLLTAANALPAAQISTFAPPPIPPVASESRMQAETYGTASVVKLHIPGLKMVPLDGDAMFEDGLGYVWAQTPLTGRLASGVNLPSGAIIQGLDLYYDDTDATDITATLYSMDGTTSVTVTPIVSVSSTGTAGKNIASSSPVTSTVDNDNKQYGLYVFNTSASIKVRAVTVRYKLQISPPPGTPTFGDVPSTHPFYQYIEALVAAGITAGCGGGNYCPDSALTRGQMAVFLARALGLHWTP